MRPRSLIFFLVILIIIWILQQFAFRTAEFAILNQKVVKAKKFNSFGLLSSWIIHFNRFKGKCLSKKFYPSGQSECREKALFFFENYSIWWECIKMRKRNLRKTWLKIRRNCFKKFFSQDFDRKNNFCWIFTIQENFPKRAQKRPRLVKNCHSTPILAED